MKILSFTPTDNLKEIEIDKSENILNSLSTIDKLFNIFKFVYYR